MEALVYAGLAAIIVMAVLVAVIVGLIVRKARAEDLPQLLGGLGQVLTATARLLPWGGPQHESLTILLPVRPDTEEEPAVEPRTVAGTIVSVNSTAAGRALSAPSQQALPATAPRSGEAQ